MRSNMMFSGEIYTTGKNFTLPPAVTGVTNSTSVAKLFILKLCPLLNRFSGQTHTLTHTHDRDIGLPSGIRDSSSLARQVL